MTPQKKQLGGRYGPVCNLILALAVRDKYQEILGERGRKGEEHGK